MEPGYLTVSGRRIRIEPIVAEVEASVCEDTLPVHGLSLRVTQTGPTTFTATPNIAVRNVVTGEIEYTCGLGNSVDTAVADALHWFLHEVDKQQAIRELAEGDFVRTRLAYLSDK